MNIELLVILRGISDNHIINQKYICEHIKWAGCGIRCFGCLLFVKTKNNYAYQFTSIPIGKTGEQGVD